MRHYLGAFIFGMALYCPALAVPPAEQLKDAKLEAQARDISKDLRCLVCQNQSIDDSDADLAKDLRRIVRERLLAGENEAQIKDFLVDRYGEFVLLNPRMNAQTWLLWGSPLLFLLFGGLLARHVMKPRREPVSMSANIVAEPNDETQALLDKLRD